MHDKPLKVIIDTNLWISFLIGLKSSSAVRSDLTDIKLFGHCQILILAQFKQRYLG